MAEQQPAVVNESAPPPSLTDAEKQAISEQNRERDDKVMAILSDIHTMNNQIHEQFDNLQTEAILDTRADENALFRSFQDHLRSIEKDLEQARQKQPDFDAAHWMMKCREGQRDLMMAETEKRRMETIHDAMTGELVAKRMEANKMEKIRDSVVTSLVQLQQENETIKDEIDELIYTIEKKKDEQYRKQRNNQSRNGATSSMSNRYDTNQSTFTDALYIDTYPKSQLMGLNAINNTSTNNILNTNSLQQEQYISPSYILPSIQTASKQTAPLITVSNYRPPSRTSPSSSISPNNNNSNNNSNITNNTNNRPNSRISNQNQQDNRTNSRLSNRQQSRNENRPSSPLIMENNQSQRKSNRRPQSASGRDSERQNPIINSEFRMSLNEKKKVDDVEQHTLKSIENMKHLTELCMKNIQILEKEMEMAKKSETELASIFRRCVHAVLIRRQQQQALKLRKMNENNDLNKFQLYPNLPSSAQDLQSPNDGQFIPNQLQLNDNLIFTSDGLYNLTYDERQQAFELFVSTPQADAILIQTSEFQ